MPTSGMDKIGLATTPPAKDKNELFGKLNRQPCYLRAVIDEVPVNKRI